VECGPFTRTQLGTVIDSDVFRQRDADRLPIGVAHRREVLDHPLRERLTLDGPLVDEPGELRGALAQGVVGGRRDAVDHGPRADHFRFDPAREIGITHRGERHQCAVQDHAVLRQVVAAKHRERRHARRAAARQRLHQPADAAARSLVFRTKGIGEVVCDVRVTRVELVLRVEAVTFFGHRQRHDARVARGQSRERRFRIRGADQQLADRSDDARARRDAKLEQGVEPLLIRKCIAQAGALERQRADGPALVRVQQRVDIECLVRAMKRARSDVHDAEARGFAVVSRQDRTRACGMQARLGEARRTHQTPV
jgi:hypothetical protein